MIVRNIESVGTCAVCLLTKPYFDRFSFMLSEDLSNGYSILISTRRHYSYIVNFAQFDWLEKNIHTSINSMRRNL